MKPRDYAVTRTFTVIAALGMLAGCNSLTPSTRIEIAFDDGGGKKITASYESAKDLAAPSFRLTRDPETGRITGIDVAAEGSAASGVIAANTDFVNALGQGIAAGLGSLAGAAAKGALGGASYSDQALYTPAALEGWQKLKALR